MTERKIYNQPDEEDVNIISRCRKGDVEAFGELVRKYQKMVYNIALKMVADRDTADDITQSAFIKAYEHLDRFKTEFPFFGWIQKIAANESLNYLKRQKRLVSLNENHDPENYDDPETEYERHELQNRIDTALEQLKPEYRIIIILRHFGELSYNEIGEILDVPEKTVKSRLFTARQELRTVLI